MSEGPRLRGTALTLRLALVAIAVRCVASGQPGTLDTSNPEVVPPRHDALYLEQQKMRTEEGLEKHRVQVRVPDAATQDVQVYKIAHFPAGAAAKPAPRKPLSAIARSHAQDILIILATLFTIVLILKKVLSESAGSVKMEFNSDSLSPEALAGLAAKVRAEEKAFAEFVTAFRVGLPMRHPPAIPPGTENTPAPSVQMPNDSRWEIDLDEDEAAEEPIEPAVASPSPQPAADVEPKGGGTAPFFADAPAWLAQMRRLLPEISCSEDGALKQNLLGVLRDGFAALKGVSGSSELLPVWQMASALEGLVQQLTERMIDITPSTLRTVANAVDLLANLCRPGIRTDLSTDPPIRLLVVDDDPISRRAVSSALKRAFDQPDLAEDGDGALTLASEHTYDVVFLDLQMPGMDGFEVCSKIHATPGNAATPVIFVTGLSDFDSRAKSILTGGKDLIAKPFLSFELTVKALTFALRGRLDRKSTDTEWFLKQV